jgi:hypothetical protein
MIFIGSGSSLVSFGSYMNFYNILDINFTFVFATFLLGMTRYKLFRGIFFWKKGFYIFKLNIFVEKLSNFSSFLK